MVLRFEVNQAEAFRQGVNVEKSTNHLDVDPSKLSQDERNLIADRLDGIDVRRLESTGSGVQKAYVVEYDKTMGRIVANLPTFEALMEAIRENEKQVRPRIDELQAAADEQNRIIQSKMLDHSV